MHPMFNATLFTGANTWKPPKCPSVEDRIKKMWYIYTMEYYATVRKDEILPCVTTRMDLENIILSEIHQSKNAKNHMISLICGI